MFNTLLNLMFLRHSLIPQRNRKRISAFFFGMVQAPCICFSWAFRALCLRILCDVAITISSKLSLPYCCRPCITVFRHKVSASRSRQGPGRVDSKIISHFFLNRCADKKCCVPEGMRFFSVKPCLKVASLASLILHRKKIIRDIRRQ